MLPHLIEDNYLIEDPFTKQKQEKEDAVQHENFSAVERNFVQENPTPSQKKIMERLSHLLQLGEGAVEEVNFSEEETTSSEEELILQENAPEFITSEMFVGEEKEDRVSGDEDIQYFEHATENK